MAPYVVLRIPESTTIYPYQNVVGTYSALLVYNYLSLSNCCWYLLSTTSLQLYIPIKMLFLLSTEYWRI